MTIRGYIQFICNLKLKLFYAIRLYSSKIWSPGGKAVIKDTWIAVDLILEKIDPGETSEELLKSLPFFK